MKYKLIKVGEKCIRILYSMYNLNWEETRIHRIIINFVIKSEWFKYSRFPPQIFSLKISEIFGSCSGWWLRKFSQQTKAFSKFSIDVFIIISRQSTWHTLREGRQYSEFYWSLFFHIWTEYREILRMSQYSIRMRKHLDQKLRKRSLIRVL